LVYIFQFLVRCSKQNLATLSKTLSAYENFSSCIGGVVHVVVIASADNTEDSEFESSQGAFLGIHCNAVLCNLIRIAMVCF
jgi:hypothetical protein